MAKFMLTLLEEGNADIVVSVTFEAESLDEAQQKAEKSIAILAPSLPEKSRVKSYDERTQPSTLWDWVWDWDDEYMLQPNVKEVTDDDVQLWDDTLGPTA